MKFGLSPQDWLTIEQIVVIPLKNLGAKVFVFGSRARGQQRKFSDLDIGFEVHNKIPLHIVGEIKDRLTQSNLPIEVDLMDLDDIADSFRDGILNERIEV